MKKIFQKSLTLFICVSLVFTLQARSVHATGLPVIDFSNLPQSIMQVLFGSSSSASAAKTLAGTLVQKSLKKISSQVTLNMTQQVINWGSTGFKGNPFFVRDQEGFFKSIADEQVEIFINEITANEADFPYARDIAKNLAISQVTKNAKSFSEKSNFNLDEVIGPNWKQFDSDFSVGGWDGWLTYVQNDANNPVGSYFQSADELQRRIATIQGSTATELDQSGGFLSAKKCVEYKDGSQGNVGGVDFDAEWFYGAVNANLQTYDVGPFATQSECKADFDTTQNTTEECHSVGGNSTSEYLNDLSIQLGDEIQFDASDDCARYETITPGKLVADQLELAVNTPKLKAIADASTGSPLVDGISNLAAGLITKGFTQLIGNISSGSEDAIEGPGDNSTFVSSSDTFTWNTADEIPLEGTEPGSPSVELTEAIDTTEAELNILTASRDLLRTFPLRTQILDQCLPGPDYKYATRMQAEFQLEAKKLESKSDNSSNNGEEAQDQLKYLNNVMSYLLTNAKTFVLIDSIPSAALITDQVKKIEEYNQDIGNLEMKVSDKLRTLALLRSIEAGIATHPKQSDGSDPENIAQYKNQLAGQYVALKEKVSREDTINESQNDCRGYVDDLRYAFKTTEAIGNVGADNLNTLYQKCSFVYDYDQFGNKKIAWAPDSLSNYTPVVTLINEQSLYETCVSEKKATDAKTKEIVGKDKAQLLFCGIDEGTNPDPLETPGWQWIKEVGSYAYKADGYVYTKGYNNESFKLDCDKIYKSNIGDYLPPNI